MTYPLLDRVTELPFEDENSIYLQDNPFIVNHDVEYRTATELFRNNPGIDNPFDMPDWFVEFYPRLTVSKTSIASGDKVEFHIYIYLTTKVGGENLIYADKFLLVKMPKTGGALHNILTSIATLEELNVNWWSENSMRV